jgi:hypothetical protein
MGLSSKFGRSASCCQLLLHQFELTRPPAFAQCKRERAGEHGCSGRTFHCVLHTWSLNKRGSAGRMTAVASDAICYRARATRAELALDTRDARRLSSSQISRSRSASLRSVHVASIGGRQPRGLGRHRHFVRLRMPAVHLKFFVTLPVGQVREPAQGLKGVANFRDSAKDGGGQPVSRLGRVLWMITGCRVPYQKCSSESLESVFSREVFPEVWIFG